MEKESWGIVTDVLADVDRMTPPQAYCQLAGSQGSALKQQACQGLNKYNCKSSKCCSYDEATGKCSASNSNK